MYSVRLQQPMEIFAAATTRNLYVFLIVEEMLKETYILGLTPLL